MANRKQSRTKVSGEPTDVPGSEKFEKEIKDLFKVFDKNGDKYLSVEELCKAMKSLGICTSFKDVQRAMKDIDKNGNGKIEFKEFRQFVISQYKQKDIVAQARESFRLFDRDGNGSIDRKELKLAMQMLGEELTDKEVDQLMCGADENNDGKINFDEFLHLWRMLHSEG